MAHASLPTDSRIIRGAQVLLPSGDIERREVAIASGKIIAVEPQLDSSAKTETIDGRGLTLLPGVIDPQVNFDIAEQPYDEALFTSTCACVKGGITSFLEMPNPSLPETDHAITKDVLTHKLAIAAEHSLANYGFFISASSANPDSVHRGDRACGVELTINSARSLPPADTYRRIEPVFAKGDRLIAFRARVAPQNPLEQAQSKKETEPATQEPEPGASPTSKSATHATEHLTLHTTQLALTLSKKYQRRLHILNLSTAEEANLLRHDKPGWVTTALTPQHLLLDVVAETEVLYHRSYHQAVLWQALLDGVIDFVTTNHIAPAPVEKGRHYPKNLSGIPGVETSLPLMLTQTKAGRCSVAQVAHWLSTAVAEAYGITDKGLIEPGYDADLVLVDLVTYRPVLRKELVTPHGWSPFEGWPLTGWPVITIVGGQVVYNRGELNTNSRGQALMFND